jgi:hypothetical protein
MSSFKRELAARTTIVFSAHDALCSEGLITKTAVLVAAPFSSPGR